jgi:hypothetical protein
VKDQNMTTIQPSTTTKNPRVISQLFIASLVMFSCVTGQKNPPKTSKNGNSKITQKDSKQEASKKTSKPIQKVETVDYGEWFAHLLKSEETYTVKDRQQLASTPSTPKPGSLMEACLVAATLRDIATPPGAGPQAFSAVDQAARTQNTAVIATAPVQTQAPLETRMRERGVDLASALTSNWYLKNSAIYSWAWNATILEGNSEPFKQNIQTVLKSEALIWQDIGHRVGIESTVGAATAPISQSPQKGDESAAATPSSGNSNAATAVVPAPVAATPSAGVANPNVNTGGLSAPDTASNGGTALSENESSKALGLAQEAAGQENYEKAVTEASKITPGSPHYDIAQENIRQWSNKAVTELRKKAAFEYRTASSSNDASAKKNALNKAQTYLSDALKKFPSASNLDTVRDNLKMIETELGH